MSHADTIFNFNNCRCPIWKSELVGCDNIRATRRGKFWKNNQNGPQFQLLKILWVAVSSTVGLRVERRHHLQSVCLQDVASVDQTDENRLGLSLVGQCYSIHLTAQT
ncbi:hypothetical protein AVEN_182399-1 [Araneus ventricosus]|uniref:Uncharacterized protein n=1 Tax=Araneus ventricosus TaxID=182803 RepID=A0A4Y2SBV3_ARAVE|nr:hypothetical protein AVEN_182399-1 [Araneus ventricosus]